MMYYYIIVTEYTPFIMPIEREPSWLTSDHDPPTNVVIHTIVSPIVPVITHDPAAVAAELNDLMNIKIDGKKHQVAWKWDPKDPVDGCAESYTFVSVDSTITFPTKPSALAMLTDKTWKGVGKEYRKTIRGVRKDVHPALFVCIGVNILCIVLTCLLNPILLLVYMFSIMPATCIVLSCYENSSIVGPSIKEFVVNCNKVLNGTPILMVRVDRHVGLTQGRNESDYVFLFVCRHGPNNV